MIMPITCEIDLSNNCQNSCRFCMFKGYRSLSPVALEWPAYSKLLADLHSIGVKSITFTGGGEPTMHPEFTAMVQLADGMGFDIGLITNGIISIEECAALFTFVRVSLDAATPKTYALLKDNNAFDEVISNITKIRADTEVGLSYVICKDNEHEIELAQELADELDISYIQFKPVYGDRLNRQSWHRKTIMTERYAISSTLPCHIAGLVGVVGADGSVWFCCQKRGEISLGNIYNSSFSNIWETRGDIVRLPDIHKCKACRYQNYIEELYNGRTKTVRHRWFL